MKINIKTLPTLRDKKRYIAFKVVSEDPIYNNELTDEILKSINSLFGDLGAHEINARIISYDGKYGIVRCSRHTTEKLRASLATINNIRGIRLYVMILGISGTIKGAIEKFIKKTCIEETEPEKRELINRNIQLNGISGKIINSHKNEIDILPNNSFSAKLASNSRTKYIGLMVFDIEEMR